METAAIKYFNKWLNEELQINKVPVPTACCMSTMGTDGYANARFIIENNFIITVNNQRSYEIRPAA